MPRARPGWLFLAVISLTMAAGASAFAQSPAEEADALAARASNLQRQGKLGEAVPLAEQALRMREAAHPAGHLQIGLSLFQVSLLYEKLGRPDDAVPLLKRALDILAVELPREEVLTVVALNRLATLHGSQRRLDEAEALYKRGLDLANPDLPDHQSVVATMLRNLALLLQEQGRLSEALPLFERTLKLRELTLPAGDRRISVSLADLAHLLVDQGRFGDAEVFLRRALDSRESAVPPDQADIAARLSDLALVLRGQGRFSEAEPLYKRALQLREAERPANSDELATVLDGLGVLYMYQDRLQDAEPVLKRSLELRESQPSAGGPSVAWSLSNLASLYASLDRLGEAEPLMRRALDILEASLPAGHPATAAITNNLATLHEKQGRLTEAETLYRRALLLREMALPPDHYDIATSHNNLASLYIVKRYWAAAQDHARRAIAIIVERAQRAGSNAFGSADAARNELKHQTRGNPFGFLMSAAWRLGAQRREQSALSEEAFIAAQWAGQSSAGAALAQMASRFANGDSALSKLVRAQQDLVRTIEQLDRRILTARGQRPEHRNAAAEADLAGRLADNKKQLSSINGRLADDFPDYASLARPQPLPFKAVQDLLQPDEALVQLAVDGDGEGFVWVVTREHARWSRIGDTLVNIAEMVQLLRCGLDRDGVWLWSPAKQRWLPRASTCTQLRPDGLAEGEPPPFSLVAAHELYEALFGSFREDIAGKRLLIVPSGALNALPFQVLVTAKPDVAVPADAAGYARASWLMRSHAITVLPSVASLKSLRSAAGKSPASRPYVAFGNPLLDGDPDSLASGKEKQALAERVQKSRDSQACAPSPGPRARQRMASLIGLRSGGKPLLRGGLGDVAELRRQSPLPETADELCAVARDLNTDGDSVYLGARTTEQMVKTLSRKGDLKSYAIVHFATHGLVSDETEGFTGSVAEPALLLTPPRSASEEDDGLLTSSEVAELELNADWVILSACNTAASGTRSANSEALSGLARAFFFAGARALLVSHWYVESDAAVKLTTRTFAELRRNPRIGRAEALRRAMLALMADTARPSDWAPAAHPAVWAPFVVVGEGAR